MKSKNNTRPFKQGDPSIGNKTFVVTEDTTLLPFLLEKLEGKSRSYVKSVLHHKQIKINGVISTQFDFFLKKGDKVTLSKEGVHESFSHPMLKVVYEDNDIVVINKKEGLLSISNDKIRERTAYFILNEYIKRKHPNQHIFIVHRLDRETSGLMLFAKSIEIQHALQEHWTACVRERKYIAVLEGHLEKKDGEISSFFLENKNFKVYASPTGEGVKAVTQYHVLKETPQMSLVEFSLETGRKNQIRAHAEYISHPIVGDKKYGSKYDPIRRVALHAYKLVFLHPRTRELLTFETPIPKDFLLLIKKDET